MDPIEYAKDLSVCLLFYKISGAKNYIDFLSIVEGSLLRSTLPSYVFGTNYSESLKWPSFSKTFSGLITATSIPS